MTNPSTYPPKAAYASDWRDAVRPPPGYRVKTTLALRSALLTLAATVRTSTTRTFVRCMYCHYVFDDQRDAFETIIVHLNRLGEFIDTKHCLQMIKGEREIDGRYFHLSFDDGFRNNLTNALPILTKHRIPCIFFIPSSLIDAPPEEVERYCRVSTEHIAPIEMLTWNDIRQLASAGYDIGSHTKTHARFAAISRDEKALEDEILGSKREIEAHLGRECKYISWPYGRLIDADEKSLEMVASAGYEACFGAYRGSVVPKVTNIRCIPRHHFEVQWPLRHILYFARGNMEHGA